MGKLKEIIYRFRAEYTTEKLIEMGMVVGENFKRLNGVILDPSHCWLIQIGDNVVIGANSVVTKSIPSDVVVCGNPVKVICTLEEYIDKNKKMMQVAPAYGEEYTLRADISSDMKLKMKEELEFQMGDVK